MKKVKNIVFYEEDSDLLEFIEKRKINFNRFIKMLMRNHINIERGRYGRNDIH